MGRSAVLTTCFWGSSASAWVFSGDGEPAVLAPPLAPEVRVEEDRAPGLEAEGLEPTLLGAEDLGLETLVAIVIIYLFTVSSLNGNGTVTRPPALLSRRPDSLLL